MQDVRRAGRVLASERRSLTHAVLTTLIVVLLVAGVGGAYQWSTRTVHAEGEGVVATINGESITSADVDHFRPLHGEPADTHIRAMVVLDDKGGIAIVDMPLEFFAKLPEATVRVPRTTARRLQGQLAHLA